jgi:Na+-translocating ferredoxin:NAD+ oxidoreductase RNF subunit RnfB
MDLQSLSILLNVSDEEIEAVYADMHKNSMISRNVNCRSCGFGTCEQFVVAVILGSRNKDNCARYSTVASMMEEMLSIKNALAEETKNLRASSTRVMFFSQKLGIMIKRLKDLV